MCSYGRPCPHSQNHILRENPIDSDQLKVVAPPSAVLRDFKGKLASALANSPFYKRLQEIAILPCDIDADSTKVAINPFRLSINANAMKKST